MIGEILGRLLALLIGTAVGLALLELGGQHSPLRGMVQYYVRDVDHRPRPHLDGMNGDGVWSRFEADHYAQAGFNVVFLGDSFVLGRGAGEGVTIPALFESLAVKRRPSAGVRAVNFGWVSASPLLEYRQLRDIGPKYRPSLVVLCLDMSDIHDDLKYAKLLERKGIFALVPVLPVTLMALRRGLLLIPFRHGPHELIFGFPARRFFASDEPLERTLPYFSRVRASIDSIASYCDRELGARFAVFVLPRSYQYSATECPRNWERREYVPLGRFAREPFRYFDRMRAEVGYPVRSLLDDFIATREFPTCFEDDPHWNATGHRIAAEAIYRDLEADRMLP